MAPVVRTSFGRVQGTTDEGVVVFRGIPYARPPVGARRFAPPQHPLPWTGVRDATTFGPAALQEDSPLAALLGTSVGPTSEDCLYLNVWTPAIDPRRRPVLVWVHGGAFISGAGSLSLYNGATLARRGDVVVVTLNYRLGVFGFLRGIDLGAGLDSTGNEGLLDQVAALQWVQQEIAAFGGDPNNVTVFGESAGAMSVAALLTRPGAAGLVRQAILQSGALNLLATPAAATEVTHTILRTLGLPPTSAGQLRGMAAVDLLAVQHLIGLEDMAEGLTFAPVLDGAVLPVDPLAAIARGSAQGVRLLVGTNLDELKTFRSRDPWVELLTAADLVERVAALVGERPDGEAQAARIIATYRQARAARGESTTPAEVWFAIASDARFRVPAMHLAALHAAHTPQTYAYLFTRPSPAVGGALGAGHALELPFVFGTLTDPSLRALTGTGWAVHVLADQLQEAWLAFARTGTPASPSLPVWPPYAVPPRRTMLLGAATALVSAPLEAERAVWDTLQPAAAVGPPAGKLRGRVPGHVPPVQ